MKPDFVTFTGLDERTDLDRVVALSHRWPVEWGILFSPKRQGKDPRYPSMEWIEASVPYLVAKGVGLSAHLCGDYAASANSWNQLGTPVPTIVRRGYFNRAQINHAKPLPAPAKWFGEQRQLVIILQTRDKFPPRAESHGLNYLYDPSGGRGLEPDSWPRGQSMVFGGYAGGINPANVAQVVRAIDAWHPYWLDMESGVRCHQNWLSLDKCAAVCAEVYGEKEAATYDAVPVRSAAPAGQASTQLRHVAGHMAGPNALQRLYAVAARVGQWLGGVWPWR